MTISSSSTTADLHVSLSPRRKILKKTIESKKSHKTSIDITAKWKAEISKQKCQQQSLSSPSTNINRTTGKSNNTNIEARFISKQKNNIVSSSSSSSSADHYKNLAATVASNSFQHHAKEIIKSIKIMSQVLKSSRNDYLDINRYIPSKKSKMSDDERDAIEYQISSFIVRCGSQIDALRLLCNTQTVATNNNNNDNDNNSDNESDKVNNINNRISNRNHHQQEIVTFLLERNKELMMELEFLQKERYKHSIYSANAQGRSLYQLCNKPLNNTDDCIFPLPDERKNKILQDLNNVNVNMNHDLKTHETSSDILRHKFLNNKRNLRIRAISKNELRLGANTSIYSDKENNIIQYKDENLAADENTRTNITVDSKVKTEIPIPMHIKEKRVEMKKVTPTFEIKDENKKVSNEVLQMENTMLSANLHSELEDVVQVESKMSELTKLMNLFTDKVLEQQVQIENIFDDTLDTIENVDEGNEHLLLTKERTRASRYFFVYFMLILSFCLLFLDYYIP